MICAVSPASIGDQFEGATWGGGLQLGPRAITGSLGCPCRLVPYGGRRDGTNRQGAENDGTYRRFPPLDDLCRAAGPYRGPI